MIRVRIILTLMAISIVPSWLQAVESFEPGRPLAASLAEQNASELAFPLQELPDSDILARRSKNTLPSKTLLARCLLAAKGVGGGLAFLCCSRCVAEGLKGMSRIHSEPPLSMRGSELFKDSNSGKVWPSILTVSFTVLVATIAYKAGEYSVGNFKEVFGEK